MSIETAIQIIRDVHTSNDALNLKLRESQEKIEELERQLEDVKRDQTEQDTLHWVRMSKIQSSLDACSIPDFGSLPMKAFEVAQDRLESAIGSIKSVLSVSIKNEIVKRQSSSSSVELFDEAFKNAMESLGVNFDLVENLLRDKNAVVFGDLVGRLVRGDPLTSLRFIDLIVKDCSILEHFVKYGYILSSFSGNEKTYDLFGTFPGGWSIFRMVNCFGRIPIRVFVPPHSSMKDMYERPTDLGILDFMNVVYDGKRVRFQKYANFLLKCHTSSNFKLPLHLVAMGASVTDKNVNSGIRIPPNAKFTSSKDICGMRKILARHCDVLNPEVKTLEDALKKNVEDHGISYSHIQQLLAVEGVYMCGSTVRCALSRETMKSINFHFVSLRGESAVHNLLPAASSSKQVYDNAGARWIEKTYTSKWCNGQTILLSYPDQFSETDAFYKIRVSCYTLDNVEKLISFDFNHTFFDGEEITVAKLECLLERRHVSKPSDEIFLSKELIERMKGYGYTFDPTPTSSTTRRVFKKDDPFDILLKNHNI